MHERAVPAWVGKERSEPRRGAELRADLRFCGGEPYRSVTAQWKCSRESPTGRRTVRPGSGRIAPALPSSGLPDRTVRPGSRGSGPRLRAFRTVRGTARIRNGRSAPGSGRFPSRCGPSAKRCERSASRCEPSTPECGPSSHEPDGPPLDANLPLRDASLPLPGARAAHPDASSRRQYGVHWQSAATFSLDHGMCERS